ncbi:MAG: FG-GAP repeat protein, partial [Phycisphaerales bacterium]
MSSTRTWSKVIVAAIAMMGSVAFGQRSTPLQVLHPAGAAGDEFGNAVAVDGDTMVVGAPSDDVGANGDQGSAHIYRWTGSGWTFEATLTATGGAAFDQFGYSVALSGDTALVGARSDDVGANSVQGSAYVFTRSGSTWTQQAQLTASDGA